MSIEPFSIPYVDSAVRDLRLRLKQTRWPDSIPDSGWEYGTDLDFMRELCDYWLHDFDWGMQIEKFSRWHHYRYTAEDIGIHFIHERGKGPHPIPIVLTHGWPGSFLEMLKVLPLLTDPASHGGDPRDSFDVVIPSLPGYGFSDRSTWRGMNTFRIAEIWDALMKEAGYEKYAAQGGDFGANVSTVLALRYPERVLGLHLNYIPGSYKPYLDPAEKLSASEEGFVKEADRWHEESGAYWHVQSMEPQTVAYGLNDSPAGLAAWLIEKFRDWADCDGDLWRRFTRDEVLTHITLYWMTETIHSSCRLYYESFRAPLHFSKDDFVRVPSAVARFPKEEPFPPREWAQRGYNVQRWTEMAQGGHFAAIEEPELLVEDIRQFFRFLR
jgi:pimeloyl-ACP methyl ester carboxylesterase